MLQRVGQPACAPIGAAILVGFAQFRDMGLMVGHRPALDRHEIGFEIGFDEVERRRQNVAEQVLGLDNLLIDRTADGGGAIAGESQRAREDDAGDKDSARRYDGFRKGDAAEKGVQRVHVTFLPARRVGRRWVQQIEIKGATLRHGDVKSVMLRRASAYVGRNC